MLRPNLFLVILLFSTQIFALDHFSGTWVNHPGEKTKFDSRDFPNSIFLINVSGCEEVHKQDPMILELSQDYGLAHRVKILEAGVNESDKTFADWISEYKPAYPIIDDEDFSLSEKLEKESIIPVDAKYPISFLVDCRGRVKYVGSGIWSEETNKRVRTAIDDLLEGDCSNPIPEDITCLKYIDPISCENAGCTWVGGSCF